MKKITVIAEAGVNHNGSIMLAKKLIEAAANAGADIVKFQTFKTENLVSQSAKKAAYQKANMANQGSDSQFEMLKKLELSEHDHQLLMQYANECGIEFWSTAFDNDSISLLRRLGIAKWKIPSGEVTNLPFLQLIGSFKEEVILSTGMCTIEEIEDAVQALVNAGMPREKLTILHCNTEYPTPMEDVNIRAMLEIRDKFKVRVGYSDHTKGIEVSIAAVALGAEVIEKHFTLDRNMEGPDHKASLEPNELEEMVRSIRNIEMALGNGHKEPSASESKNIVIARKSIHINKDLKQGHVLSEDDTIMIRPGDGISPMDLPKVIGKSINKNLVDGHQLSISDLTA